MSSNLRFVLLCLTLFLLTACLQPFDYALSIEVLSPGGSSRVANSEVGITCDAACKANLSKGTSLTLSAVPASNESFNSWQGCDTVSGYTCSVLMTTNKTVRASFIEASSFTVAVLPDTQYYSTNNTLIDYFTDQTTWIAEQAEANNIVFVSHEGDVVQRGSSESEWQRSNSALSILDGRVPYSVAIGDHDYQKNEDRSEGAELYLEYFGPERYEAYDWYGGAAPNGLGHFQFFEANGHTFLHIALEWEAPGPIIDPLSPLGWANSILELYPTFPTIITTHSYLWDQGGYEGHALYVEENMENGTSPVDIYSQLIRPHPQVFMVLGGNYHRGSDGEDGEWHQVSYNDAGLEVYEMLANYQTYANGGDGWMRLLEFVPDGGESGLDRIQVKTYSPSLDAYRTGERSEFYFDLSFSDRFRF